MSSYLKSEEDLYNPSPCISPPRSSRKTSPSSTPPRPSRKTNQTKNNPYATRGLDKFSALKAELEQKKQRIYSQDNSQNISLVRFAYSNSSDNAVPIVIKSKVDQNEITSNLSKQDSFAFENKYPVESSSSASASSSSRVKEIREKARWGNRLGYFNDPVYYVPVVLIFILVLLTFLGRSIAVLFTSLGWYSLPSLLGESLKRSRKKRKNQDQSEKKKKMVITGTHVTETLHAHRKSW